MNYYEHYCPESDMTFITRERDDGNYVEVTGFYFGKPQPNLTEMFKDKGIMDLKEED